MRYDSHEFDFPGRRFELRHAAISPAAALAALRGLAGAVEPTVVELLDEERAIFHLVGDDGRGGAYNRDPTRTATVPRIDTASLVAWFEQAAQRGPIEEVSIASGWYAVEAHSGDSIRLESGTAEIVEHHDRRAVRAPTPILLVAPFAARLFPQEGVLELVVHWAAWTDADGVGHGPFQRMLGHLAAAGWSIAARPAAEDLTWRRPAPVPAPVVVLPARPRANADRTSPWVAVPAARVIVGITEDERDALTERLVGIEREEAEAEGSLGFRPYDDAKRRAAIHAALASSVGHTEVDVAAFEIQRIPVTNAMWRAYMNAAGAAKPTVWPAPDDKLVVGVSADEASAFAAHHGWSLPSEAQWQHAAASGLLSRLGASEYTSDRFGGDPNLVTMRGDAGGTPWCAEGRRGIARDLRYRFAVFRCVR